MTVTDLRSLDLNGKRVLIREDLNVPVKDGRVASDARIRAAMPTIEYVLDAGGKLMVMSHLGRPKEGTPLQDQPEASMQPVALHFEEVLGKKVRLVDNYLDGVEFGNEDFILFENVRVNEGEKKNDEKLARRLAALCDVFVMDAFGTAHRAQASTEGVARYAPTACAGHLLARELRALEQAVANPERPVVAIVGGSKVSTKLEVLDALSEKVDTLIVGGGIANTFLKAEGFEIGQSLSEPDLVENAKALLKKVNVPMPTDVVTATGLDDPEGATIKTVGEIQSTDMILDIGPDTRKLFGEIIRQAGTIIWNGPVGVFEIEAFAAGTESLAKDIGANRGFSIAGGGDTLAAIEQFGVTDDISYISTGGGAFLEFVEGKDLPAVKVLQERVST